MKAILFLSAATVATLALATPRARAQAPDHAGILASGKLTDGEATLSAWLAEHPDDNPSRVCLGVVQLARTFESVLQALQRHGFRIPGGPGIALGENPDPTPITYDIVHTLLHDRIVPGLDAVDKTLALVTDPEVKLPVAVNRIRFDLRGDGKPESMRSLSELGQSMRGLPAPNPAGEPFLIHFDKGDVHWLRGYCNLLGAGGEILLAHDCRESFEALAPALFPLVETADNAAAILGSQKGDNIDEIADLVAAVHLIHWEVKDAERLKSAHARLLEVIARGRLTWEAINAEMDDDREWIPNPRQTSVTATPVSAEMIKAWTGVLDETEAVLQGRLLAPHWRLPAGHGINVRRAFLEPRPFDLILWIHGRDALPFTEKGQVSSPETWRQLTQVYRGDFLTYAFWFN